MNKIDKYMKNKFFLFLTGFRKTFNKHNILSSMIESCNMSLYKDNKIGAISIEI